MKIRRTQSLHFWFNFAHPFSPEDDRNRKNIISGEEKRQPMGYPNISKPRLDLFSPFPENMITFCNIWTGFSSLAAFLGTTPTFLKRMS